MTNDLFFNTSWTTSLNNNLLVDITASELAACVKIQQTVGQVKYPKAAPLSI